MHVRIERSVSAVIGAGLAGVAAASAAQEVASPEAAPIVFCAGAANMPMSQAGSPPGFDVEIAEAIAAELGRAARFEWLGPRSPMASITRSDRAAATSRSACSPPRA